MKKFHRNDTVMIERCGVEWNMRKILQPLICVLSLKLLPHKKEQNKKMWSGDYRWKLIRKKWQTGGTTIACGWGGGWTQFGRLDRKPGTLSHVYSVVYPYMEFRYIKHHKERHRKKEKNFWSEKKKEVYSTNMKEYSPVNRVHTEWQCPLSGV